MMIIKYIVINVVIDTNVIISAALSQHGNPAAIFEMVLHGKIQNFTSREIIEEINDVLHRPKFNEKIGNFKREFMLDNFDLLSIKVIPLEKINEVTEDPDDNKFLECAIAADVHYIISGDNHLLALKRFRQIEIVSPAEFSQIIKSWQIKNGNH